MPPAALGPLLRQGGELTDDGVGLVDLVDGGEDGLGSGVLLVLVDGALDAQVLEPELGEPFEVVDRGQAAEALALVVVEGVLRAGLGVDRGPDGGVAVAALDDVDVVGGLGEELEAVGDAVEVLAAGAVVASGGRRDRDGERAELLLEDGELVVAVLLAVGVDIDRDVALGADADVEVGEDGVGGPGGDLVVGDGAFAAGAPGVGDDLAPERDGGEPSPSVLRGGGRVVDRCRFDGAALLSCWWELVGCSLSGIEPPPPPPSRTADSMGYAAPLCFGPRVDRPGSGFRAVRVVCQVVYLPRGSALRDGVRSTRPVGQARQIVFVPLGDEAQ